MDRFFSFIFYSDIIKYENSHCIQISNLWFVLLYENCPQRNSDTIYWPLQQTTYSTKLFSRIHLQCNANFKKVYINNTIYF